MAGVKNGDIITKIDDYEVNKMSNLKRYIYQKNPGDIVSLYIKRGNKELKVDVTLTPKL